MIEETLYEITHTPQCALNFAGWVSIHENELKGISRGRTSGSVVKRGLNIVFQTPIVHREVSLRYTVYSEGVYIETHLSMYSCVRIYHRKV